MLARIGKGDGERYPALTAVLINGNDGGLAIGISGEAQHFTGGYLHLFAVDDYLDGSILHGAGGFFFCCG